MELSEPSLILLVTQALPRCQRHRLHKATRGPGVGYFGQSEEKITLPKRLPKISLSGPPNLTRQSSYWQMGSPGPAPSMEPACGHSTQESGSSQHDGWEPFSTSSTQHHRSAWAHLICCYRHFLNWVPVFTCNSWWWMAKGLWGIRSIK